jgi:putative transposase
MSRAYKFHEKDGLYFITFATIGWIDVFTRRVYKDILLDSIKYCQLHKGFVVYAWCIMSNHVHLIARAENENLPDILRDLKKFTSVKLFEAIGHPTESRKPWIQAIFKKSGEYNNNNRNFQVWRQDNHPILIYSNEVIDEKLNYIHNNPVEAGWVDEPEHYLYSSARDYAGIKGLLDIH